ncbi:MAG TPA: MraY family glycosyltransferase [Saprospiraceae bacterium]|nr:MraY family glycosyltransferase [Saprospiraceae bacterium]
MFDIILAFITAFSLTFLAIPSIIRIARKKNLVDVPDSRRAHKTVTPSLGGIAIFAGMIFSIILWTPFYVFKDLQYILCAFIIIFLIGAKDDIDPISPSKKFLGQLFAALIVVSKANIKLTSMYGIFGIYDLSNPVSIVLSVFTIIVIINAFNLIDGINGLSAGIGILISITVGYWFFLIDRIDLAIIAFALAGSTIAFLKYNVTPAKIFMGDTGSLLLGMVCSILTIQFIESHRVLVDHPYAFKSAPSVAVGILILPLFDTLRVFILRIANGKSPFHPDRNHIHHVLIDTGLSHMQATSLLIVINFLFIVMVMRFHKIGSLNLLILIGIIAFALSLVLSYFYKKRKIPSQS